MYRAPPDATLFTWIVRGPLFTGPLITSLYIMIEPYLYKHVAN